MVWQAIQFAAGSRAVVYLVPLLGMQIGVLLFVGIAFFVGARAYDWRMDFADRHPKLYRITQAWRILLGLFALGTVWYSYTAPSVTMATTVTGTLPTWVFALFTLGFAALVSIGVTAFAHVVLSAFRLVNGGGEQKGAPPA